MLILGVVYPLEHLPHVVGGERVLEGRDAAYCTPLLGEPVLPSSTLLTERGETTEDLVDVGEKTAEERAGVGRQRVGVAVRNDVLR